MTMHKSLESPNCTWSVAEISVWCEASIRCNKSKESKRAWIYSWATPSSQSKKLQEWLLEDHGDQVVDQLYPRNVGWPSCLANLQAKKAEIPVVLRKKLAQYKPNVALSCWNTAFGFFLRRDSTSGSKSSLMNSCCSGYPEYVGGEIACCVMAPQTLILGIYPLCRSTALTRSIIGQVEAGLVRKHYILHSSDGNHVFITVWGVAGFWKIEPDVKAREPLVHTGRQWEHGKGENNDNKKNGPRRYDILE